MTDGTVIDYFIDDIDVIPVLNNDWKLWPVLLMMVKSDMIW